MKKVYEVMNKVKRFIKIKRFIKCLKDRFKIERSCGRIDGYSVEDCDACDLIFCYVTTADSDVYHLFPFKRTNIEKLSPTKYATEEAAVEGVKYIMKELAEKRNEEV